MADHYVYRTVNGKRVRMPAARAARIRAKVTTPAKPKAKPKPKPRARTPYDGLAGGGVGAAVNSVIGSQLAPLRSQRNDVNTTTRSNLAANAGLARQTQGTLASLMEDARRGKGAMLMTAAQGAAAMRGAQSGAVQELQQAFGPQAMNEQTRALIAQGMQAPSAALNAASVGDIYGAGLGGQMQQDFFGRAQAVAAVSQQSFNEEQRRQQAAAVRKIAEAIAGVKGQAGALRRQFVREDAQFGLERRSAEQAFGLQVAGMEGAAAAGAASAAADAEQRQYDRGQDAIDNQEDYAALRLREQGQRAKGGKSTAGQFGFRIDKKYDTSLSKILRVVDQNPRARYRATVTAISNTGVNRTQALLLAAKWLPHRLRVGGPKQLRRTMQEYGADEGVQKKVFAMAGYKWRSWISKTSAPIAGGGGGGLANGPMGTNPTGIGGYTGGALGSTPKPNPQMPVWGWR